MPLLTRSTLDLNDLMLTSTSMLLVELVVTESLEAMCDSSCLSNQTNLITLCNSLPQFSHTHWRILPLVYAAIKRLGLMDQIDPEVVTLLKKKTLEGSMHELLKKKQLHTILELLATHEIPVILLKGTAFSEWLYTSEVPRLSSDLDILVRQCDWLKTVNILSNTMDRVGKPVVGVFDDLYEISFKPTDQQIKVELDLHQHLTHPTLFDIDMAKIWDNCVEHPVIHSDLVRMMSPEDAIIHQALHSFKDAEYKTYNLIDTALLLRQEISMQVLRRRAVAQKAHIALYILLEQVALATNDEQLHDEIHLLNVNRIRVNAIKWLLTLNVSSTDILNKSWKFRFRQFGFHAFMTCKPLSILHLQFEYLKAKLAK